MNKKLLSSVREYKKQSVLAPILVILEVLMEVLIPLEMAKIIDRPETWRQLRQQDMQRIYDMIFFTRCRISPSKISTTFQPQVWSHD